MDQSVKMFKLVKSFLDSDKSQKKFCAEHGLSPSTFSYWVRKWKQEQQAPAPAFVQIEQATPNPDIAEITIN
jgi:transposase-like protein